MYATARPYEVDKEKADTIVSSDEIALERGNKLRVAATPAVKFSWVSCVPWSSPAALVWNVTVTISCGSIRDSEKCLTYR